MTFLRIRKSASFSKSFSIPARIALDELSPERGRAVLAEIHGATTIVVDGAPALLGGAATGFRVDTPNLMRNACGTNLVLWVASLPPGRTLRSEQFGFLQFLRNCGMRVACPQAETTGSGLREREHQADGAVHAAMLRWSTRADVDTIVLVGGDGGSIRAVTEAQRAGKKVIVLAWSGSLHPALAQASDAWAYLEDCRDFVLRRVQ